MAANPNRSALGQNTLPGAYYTSQDVYERETERIFRNSWLYAGRTSQIKEAGQYFLLNIDTESIIVLNAGDGKFQAFHNVCRHRGTLLCTEEHGRFSKTIQCSYHAWTYSLTGNLVGAPMMDEVNTFDKGKYPLHRVALEVLGGGLFINLADHPTPFTTDYAPLVGKFDRWNLANLEVGHRLIYNVNANWKLVLQNYSECYHCPSLHPQLNRLTPFRDSWNDLEQGPFLGGPMKLAQDGGSMTMHGNRCAAPLGSIEGEDLNLIYYYVIFPNYLLSLHPDYVLVHRAERVAVDQTRIICEWLFEPTAIAQPEFDPSSAVEFWNTTNKQDWYVCELSQKGISSKAYTPGPYAELESMIAALDRHYLGMMGDL